MSQPTVKAKTFSTRHTQAYNENQDPAPAKRRTEPYHSTRSCEIRWRVARGSAVDPRLSSCSDSLPAAHASNLCGLTHIQAERRRRDASPYRSVPGRKKRQRYLTQYLFFVSPVTKCSVPYTRHNLSMATESCSQSPVATANRRQ